MKTKQYTVSHWLVVLFFAAFLSGLFPQPAHAQANCDAVVVDQANVFGNGQSQVETAANRLVQLSATVRIRTITSFGSAGNLDNYEARLEKDCASWRAPDGGTKNNLIVLIIAVEERETGLYAGSQWTQVVGNNWNRIQSDLMNPRFRDGDFAGGFVAGMDELARLINAEIRPATAAPVIQQPAAPIAAPAVPTPVQQPAVVVVQQPSTPAEPVDFSGLWQVLLLFGSIGAVVAIAVAIYSAYTKRKTEEEHRATAQQRARIAQQGAAERITNWSLPDSEFAVTQALVGSLSSQASEADLAPLQKTLKEADDLASGASTSYNSKKQSAGDPDTPGLSVFQYENIEDNFTSVLKLMEQAEEKLRETKKQEQALRAVIDEAPKALEAARASIKDAYSKVAAIAQQGFNTAQAEAQLQQASALLDSAANDLASRNIQHALVTILQALKIVEEAIKSVANLPAKRKKIQEDLGALNGEIENTKAVVELTATVFDQMDAKYNDTLLDSVEGNGTEAENRIDAAMSLAQQAKTHSDEQQWDEAKNTIDQAEKLLAEVKLLMKAIVDLDESLKVAADAAAHEVQTAQDDIDKAGTYIQSFDPDIPEELETKLASAQNKLNQAKAILEGIKPDFFEATHLAQQANSDSDEILASARDHHEEAERIRVLAKFAIPNAETALSRAQNYINVHADDITKRTLNTLNEAILALDHARSAPQSDQINLGQAAQTAADRAYRQAQADVKSAEEKREQARLDDQQRQQAILDEIARQQQHSQQTTVIVVPTPPRPRRRDEDNDTPRRRDDDDDNNSSSGGGLIGGSSSWGSSNRIGGSSSWSSSPSRSSARVGGSSKW